MKKRTIGRKKFEHLLKGTGKVIWKLITHCLRNSHHPFTRYAIFVFCISVAIVTLSIYFHYTNESIQTQSINYKNLFYYNFFSKTKIISTTCIPIFYLTFQSKMIRNLMKNGSIFYHQQKRIFISS